MRVGTREGEVAKVFISLWVVVGYSNERSASLTKSDDIFKQSSWAK